MRLLLSIESRIVQSPHGLESWFFKLLFNLWLMIWLPLTIPCDWKVCHQVPWLVIAFCFYVICATPSHTRPALNTWLEHFMLWCEVRWVSSALSTCLPSRKIRSQDGHGEAGSHSVHNFQSIVNFHLDYVANVFYDPPAPRSWVGAVDCSMLCLALSFFLSALLSCPMFDSWCSSSFTFQNIVSPLLTW